MTTSILIISPEPWSAPAVSKHHYALTLSELGANVFYLEPPECALDDIQLQTLQPYPNLTLVRGPRVVPGLRFYPPLIRRWLEARWLVKLEQRTGCKFDTIWLFENSRFYDLRFAGDRLKIYHQVDLNQDFHPDLAAESADICFCTTDFIQQRLVRYNPLVFKIHHGLAEFDNAEMLSTRQLANFEQHVLHAVYIGNLDIFYLDLDLLTETVRKHHAVCFHFVGEYSETGLLRMKAQGIPNVVWWGKVLPNMIPAILERADALLVTYRASEYREQLASPHKMMEYLASGKVTVATYTDEYRDKRHLLEMVDYNDDFISAFDRVVNNLDEYNSPERQQARINFARQHSYDKQLSKIFSLLEEHGLDNKLSRENS